MSVPGPPDGPNSQGASAEKAPKKPLQELTKDELIHKCKGLLVIATRAKTAKDGKYFCSKYRVSCQHPNTFADNKCIYHSYLKNIYML
jgi:hypothetical protein